MGTYLLRSFLVISAMMAVLHAQPSPIPTFEVATVKPTPADWNGGRWVRMQASNEFVARNYPLRILIATAYNLSPQAVLGGPDWVDREHYDILGKTPGEVRPSQDEQMTMLRGLLGERFALTFHREPRPLPVYVLTIAKNGPTLTQSKSTAEDEQGGTPPLFFVLSPTVIRVPGRNVTITELTYIMQRAAFDRPVLDRTGLKDRYDFDLEFAPDESLFGGILPSPRDPTKPGIFTALQEQLGLKLEATRANVDALVIDGIERPTEN